MVVASWTGDGIERRIVREGNLLVAEERLGDMWSEFCSDQALCEQIAVLSGDNPPAQRRSEYPPHMRPDPGVVAALACLGWTHVELEDACLPKDTSTCPKCRSRAFAKMHKLNVYCYGNNLDSLLLVDGTEVVNGLYDLSVTEDGRLCLESWHQEDGTRKIANYIMPAPSRHKSVERRHGSLYMVNLHDQTDWDYNWILCDARDILYSRTPR